MSAFVFQLAVLFIGFCIVVELLAFYRLPIDDKAVVRKYFTSYSMLTNVIKFGWTSRGYDLIFILVLFSGARFLNCTVQLALTLSVLSILYFRAMGANRKGLDFLQSHGFPKKYIATSKWSFWIGWWSVGLLIIAVLVTLGSI